MSIPDTYPTADQIQARMETMEAPSDLLHALTYWRVQYGPVYRTGDAQTRHRCLLTLAASMAPTGAFIAPGVAPGYTYAHDTKTLYLGPRPSIISTLHEVAHAHLGASELDVCALSVLLFKTVYPRAYRKLVWQGHMLVKPSALNE